MQLVRRLVFIALKFNIRFSAIFVPGVENVLVDRLSRLQITASELKLRGMNW